MGIGPSRMQPRETFVALSRQRVMDWRAWLGVALVATFTSGFIYGLVVFFGAVLCAQGAVAACG